MYAEVLTRNMGREAKIPSQGGEEKNKPNVKYIRIVMCHIQWYSQAQRKDWM